MDDSREPKDSLTRKLPKERNRAVDKDSITVTSAVQKGPSSHQEIVTKFLSGASGGDSLSTGSEERFSILVQKQESSGVPKMSNQRQGPSKGSDERRTLLSTPNKKVIDRELKYQLIDDASNGEIGLFKKYEELLKSSPIESVADYDRRTPLHLAAVNGHLDLVKYMVNVLGYDVFFKDRWQRSAYDEAVRSEKQDVEIFLKKCMDAKRPVKLSHEIIEAACQGDLPFLRSCHEKGHDMSFPDYDRRTPLHLAVAEGRKEVVEFLIKDCNVNQSIKDRYGNTAYSEAIRCENEEIRQFILKLNDLI